MPMNGYLNFLKSLSVYQQRAEIGRLVFIERGEPSSLGQEVLKDPAVSAFIKTLGIHPGFWKFDLTHYAEEPDLIGTPIFCDDQCRAPFSFCYKYLRKNFVIKGIIYVDDDGSVMIGTLTCLSNQKIPKARRRLGLAGINPDTLKTLSNNRRQRKALYLDYIKSLMPQQRRDAIFELAELACRRAVHCAADISSLRERRAVEVQ
jgi:hypothetical protein